MRLIDAAKVLRSKNSGPFEVTLDVLFDNMDAYERACRVLTTERVAALYRLPLSYVAGPYRFDHALGIKLTLDRVTPSGTCGDRDVYGAQQHAPLMTIEI